MQYVTDLVAKEAHERTQFLYPVKMTFASADPVKALAFVQSYLGAKEIPQPHFGGDGKCGTLKWCLFPAEKRHPFQLHFVRNKRRRATIVTLDEFQSNVHASYERWAAYTQLMDFHPTMSTDNLDPFVARLVRDRVPFLVQSVEGRSSIFVEIPLTGVIELVGPDPAIIMPAKRPQAGCFAPFPPVLLKDEYEIANISYHEPLPSLHATRATYAMMDSVREAHYVSNIFGGKVLNTEDGCRTISKVLFEDAKKANGYELWFVRASNPSRLEHYEQFLRNVHGDVSKTTYDVYMDSHLGLAFENGDSIVRRLQQYRIEWFERDQYGTYFDVFIEGPSGQIYEAMNLRNTLVENPTPWNLCGKTNSSDVQRWSSFGETRWNELSTRMASLHGAHAMNSDFARVHLGSGLLYFVLVTGLLLQLRFNLRQSIESQRKGILL